jgi:hypothetical protein
MNPYINIPEADTYIQERLESLPLALSRAVSDDSIYNQTAKLLMEYHINTETIELIKYEILMVLMRIAAIDELPSVFMVEYGIELQRAVEITQRIKSEILINYLPLLTRIPDDELEFGDTAPAPHSVDAEIAKAIPEVPKTFTQPASTMQERLELRPEGVKGVQWETAELKSTPVPEKQHAPLAATRTMARDIESVKSGQSGFLSQKESGASLAPIPRYAKPLTNTPNHKEA